MVWKIFSLILQFLTMAWKMVVWKVVKPGKVSLESDSPEPCSLEKDVAPFLYYKLVVVGDEWCPKVSSAMVALQTV